MAEEAEKGSQHRFVYGSSSPTPAASSAGASSPAIPANMTSVDWCGLGKGQKGGSLSRSGPHPPWQSATSANTAGASAPVTSQPACRPWDRGDLLKRLSTFKSANWLTAPKVAGALACARRGWVNVEDDLISCEACGMQIRFLVPSSQNHGRGETSLDAYYDQLDNGHKSCCPWKGNPCAESLAQFLPLHSSALAGGFDDRCDALLQFKSLPVISGAAIDQMKLTKGAEIDRLLSKPPPSLGKKLEDGRLGSLDTANNPYYQAQRLISLCGWEPRFLPHVLDCEEHSAQSTRKDKSAHPDEGPSQRLQESSMLLGARANRVDIKGPMMSESNCDPLSAVLDCSLCGATVSLKSYATTSRPSALMPSGLIETPEPRQKHAGSLMRNTSAASGIEGWRAHAAPPLKGSNPKEEAGDTVVAVEEKMSSHNGALDLNLTVVSGPVPTLPSVEPASDSLQLTGQLEGSEMGGPVASYESFGPGFAGHRMDEGGSTVDRPQSRMHRTDSIEGTVLDFEGDEADDGEVRRKRSYVGDSSKRKRGGESSAGEQLSYGLAITEPGCSNFGQAEADLEADDTERLKRNRREEILQEISRHRIVPAQRAGNSVYSSSVIAVDTSNSKQENSMESVENLPQDSDLQATAFSWERSERAGNEDLNDLEQAQQSACHQGNAGPLNDGPSHPGVSTSDEGGVDTGTENDAACFAASMGIGHGVSVGMSGGSVQMVASHEAEIHGADFSVHKMDSFANDAELITELTDFHRQTSESVPGRTQSLQDERKITNVQHNSVDSREAAPSFSAAKVYSGIKHEESGQEESSEGKQKGNWEQLGDKLPDVNHNLNIALLQTSTSCKEAEAGFRALASLPANGGKRRGSRRLRERGGELDPVHEHHYYCPWINGHVAAAGVSDHRVRTSSLCGWQLTIDALDELQMQNRIFSAPMESESAASMHKGTGDYLFTGSMRQSTPAKKH